METYRILFFLLPLFVLLHITEEFVFPGGFMAWDRKYRPGIAKDTNPRFLIIINLLLVAICFNPLLSGLTSGGVKWWLAICSILFVNSYFHIKGVAVLKIYSPGVVTSVFLYIPFAIFGYWYFLSNGNITPFAAFLCSLTGIAYHLFSAFNPLRSSTNITDE